MYRILPHFTATRLQAATYLGGIALFSIAFLVFLNASVSFVITDVLGRRSNVGSAVGTLGFADELVALVACPLWGLVSDRIGVRWVAVAGYCVIGFSLICLVQSAHVYPDLVIWRMVFSIGGAACTTMVTAILPAMTAPREDSPPNAIDANAGNAATTQDGGVPDNNRHSLVPSVSSDMTITPARFQSRRKSTGPLLARYRHRRRSVPQIGLFDTKVDPSMDASRLAGFVGMFTGIGALVALGLFLPLPTLLGKDISKAHAVQSSFYIVGAVAFLVSIFVAFGLRNLPGESHKSLHQLFRPPPPKSSHPDSNLSYTHLLLSALRLGVTDPNISLGYVGGFVARASSVGISSFIPLFVNAYFIRTGLCPPNPGSQLRDSCERAYRLASMLTGISQLVALLAAPLYGFFNARFARRRFASKAPLALAAAAGIVGYTLFATLASPDPKVDGGRAAILAVVLIGISQIGAIVCSLALLAHGIHTAPPAPGARSGDGDEGEEGAPLLGEQASASVPEAVDRSRLKGSIAGVYSLAGGAAILLLTKLGGHLFDVADPGAPFYLLAGFNVVLLLAVAGISTGEVVVVVVQKKKQHSVSSRTDAESAEHNGPGTSEAQEL